MNIHKYYEGKYSYLRKFSITERIVVLTKRIEFLKRIICTCNYKVFCKVYKDLRISTILLTNLENIQNKFKEIEHESK